MQEKPKNWMSKHPIASFFIFIIILAFVLANLTGSSNNIPDQDNVTSVAQTEALESDLNSWSEGRWTDVVVGQDDDIVLVRAYAYPNANETAINSYCEILKDSVDKYSDKDFRTNLYIYQFGELAKVCN